MVVMAEKREKNDCDIDLEGLEVINSGMSMHRTCLELTLRFFF